MLDYLLNKLIGWINEKTRTVDHDYTVDTTAVTVPSAYQLQPHVPRKKLPSVNVNVNVNGEKVPAQLPLYVPTPLPRPVTFPAQSQLDGMAKGRGTPHWVVHPGAAKPNGDHLA
jgi:hypothetical protein